MDRRTARPAPQPRRGGGRREPREQPEPREPAAPAKLTQRGFLKFLLPPIRLTAEELVAALTSEPPPPSNYARGFAEVRDAVAGAKALLDVIPAAEFDGFMRGLDLHSGLKRALREEYGAQIATNASLKMHELLVQMRLLAGEAGAAPRLRAFCNAELPGAFVAAINHYVRTRCPETTLEWLASSYYPEAAFASGDATIVADTHGVYAGNRERWLMGPRPNALPAGAPDLSGDLTDAATVAALAGAVHRRYAGGGPSGATLYTSDAGIDVSADYNRQEGLTARLNCGQVVAGLLALAPGGHLVVKQYTFVAPFSRSLIALVAALFDEAFVTKPLASRPVNSEVYLVGRGFRGLTPALAEALLDRLAALPEGAGDAWPPLLAEPLYAAVDEVLLRAARQIHARQQVAFLEEAAGFYARFRGRSEDLGRALSRDAGRAQEAWLLANPLRRVREDYLVATGRAARQPGADAPGPKNARARPGAAQ